MTIQEREIWQPPICRWMLLVELEQRSNDDKVLEINSQTQKIEDFRRSIEGDKSGENLMIIEELSAYSTDILLSLKLMSTLCRSKTTR